MHEDFLEYRRDLSRTIGNLRTQNEAQAEVIDRLDAYRRTLRSSNKPDEDARMGFRNGYGAELDYLQLRRQALDVLIGSIEKYNRAMAHQQGGEVTFRLR